MKEWLIALAIAATLVICSIAVLWFTGFILYFGWTTASTFVNNLLLPN